MGALTDHHRKRRFVELCSPFSAFDCSPATSSRPSAKNLKFLASAIGPRFPAASASCRIGSFPPVAHWGRPVHGPQRILRAFRSGLSGRAKQVFGGGKGGTSAMGNFFSGLFGNKKDFSLRRGETSWEGQDGRLDFEEYRRRLARPQDGYRGKKSFNLMPSDLTVVTVEDDDPSYLHVLNRRVGDARRTTLESLAVREEGVMVKKPYKELYDAAKNRDSKLARLEFEVKFAEKKISHFNIASKTREKKPKEDLRELFYPLTDEEENEVFHALCSGNSQEVLVTHEPSNIEITRKLLQCLNKGAWLNDEVINLYLELLKEREKREPKRFLKCHFFNTFFYKKLTSGRTGYDFKSIRRWTTQKKLGYGLIECDKIFVPIHKDFHWCLAVINVKDETFQYLDSLGGMDRLVLRVLARYLVDEVKDKSHKDIDTMSWKQESANNLPLQKNGWDCGMFMLKYCDFYSRGLDLCFSQEHMEYFRKRTVKEILRLRAE